MPSLVVCYFLSHSVFSCIDGMLRILGTARVRLFDAAHRRFVLRAAHRQQHRRRRQLDSTFRLGRNHLHHSAHALETGQLRFSSHYSFCGQEIHHSSFSWPWYANQKWIRTIGRAICCWFLSREIYGRPPVVTQSHFVFGEKANVETGDDA